MDGMTSAINGHTGPKASVASPQKDMRAVWPQRVRDARFYSDRLAALLQALASEPDMREQSFDLKASGVVAFMGNYKYRMSAWPIIVSQERIREFDHFIATLPEILFKAIREYFGSDGEAFARYLNVPAVILDLLNDLAPHPRDLFFRHDVIFSEGSFKLLEVNAGSTIGGWQHDWLAGQFRSILDSHDTTAGWGLEQRAVLEGTFRATFDSIRRLKGERAEGHVLICSQSDDEEYTHQLEEDFQTIFRRARPAGMANGRLLFYGDFADIVFHPDGRISYNGVVADALLLTIAPDIDVPKDLYIQLLKSVLSGQVFCPDTPVHTLLGRKSLLALVHEPDLQPRLSTGEQQFIRRYIPWTAKLSNPVMHWQGSDYPAETLLLAQREQLVIKKSQSMEGRDVFVGRYTPADEWRRLVHTHRQDHDWLVQAFCAADEIGGCDQERGLCSYQPVWGVFAVANRYGGAFVRGDVSGSGDGVINSAKGATEFIVFEEAKRRNRLVI